MNDILIWSHRKLRPVVNALGINGVARRVYRALARLRYGENGICTTTQNGRTWRLHRDVAQRGELQEFDTIVWLREVVRPGMTVIDVGANVGQMTLEMAELVGPSGRVIAIEPSLGNLEYLRDHVEANGYSGRVTVIPAACSEKDGGELTLFLATTDAASTIGSGHNIIGADPILKTSDGVAVREVRVPQVSLDAVCARMDAKPSVIKIDVEGAELMVLRGAAKTLRAASPAVRIGFHPFAFSDPRAATQEFVELAAGAGYSIEGYEPDRALELEEYNLKPVTAV